MPNLQSHPAIIVGTCEPEFCHLYQQSLRDEERIRKGFLGHRSLESYQLQTMQILEVETATMVGKLARMPD
jgi:hypothetical protein